MNETNKIHCRRCGMLKTRIEDGKFPDGRNKRYVDEAGKLWSGRTCNQCLNEKMKERMRHSRFLKKINTPLTKEELKAIK